MFRLARRSAAWLLALGTVWAFAAAAAAAPAPARPTAPARVATGALDGRVIVGYQGWFGCPGDFAGNREWQHWFQGAPAPGTLTVDMLPSVRGFRAQDLCDTGLKRADGSAVRVFSSQNATVVDRHLQWMKQHGIDGLAFQRFVAHTRDARLRARSDNVLGHVADAARRHGRVFYVTYDVAGADPAWVVDAIRADWAGIAARVAGNPAYLRQGGKPLVQLWGFGLVDHPGAPAEVARLITDLQRGAAGLPAATVIGGVPAGWRTLTGDSQGDPAWATTYRLYDVLSPWTVGRFADDAGADRFRARNLAPDLEETRRLGIGYQPVVFPGFSWRNLMLVRGQPDRAIPNQIPRRCGRFLARQVDNAIASGASSLYVAMFDEVDEGTALLPVDGAPAPAGTALVTFASDGCALADDTYLRAAGAAARRVKQRRAR